MKSLNIPNYITLNVFESKNKNVIIIKDSETSLWFLTEDDKISLKGRSITASSETIRCIKKSLNSIEIGHKRTLTLLGVGYKAWVVEDNHLAVKVSSVKPFIFKIPNDLSIQINKNEIVCWSYHVNIIDNFFKKILLKVNFSKWQ